MPNRFRSDQAQSLHRKIMTFIQATEDDARSLLAEVSNLWYELCDTSAITEKSINGYTHLMDAFHLPYEIHEADKKLAHIKTRDLFNLMMRATPLATKKILLLERCDKGFTPLHSAANSGVSDIYFAFKDILMAELTREERAKALWAKTRYGYVPSCQVGGNKQAYQCVQINEDLDRARKELPAPAPIPRGVPVVARYTGYKRPRDGDNDDRGYESRPRYLAK